MIYKFKCPLFRIKVLLVTGDKKQLAKYTEDFGDNCYNAETHTIYDKKSIIDGFLIWIKDPMDYHGLIHETIHLLKRIFECVGIPLTLENEEMIAYYQNYWARKFWHKMSKNLKEVKL